MPRLSHVLILDPDSKSLETLKYGFEGDGVKVTGLADPEKLTNALAGAGVQVVVASLRQPTTSILEGLARLRGSDTTKNLPALLLGPPDTRAAAVDLGAAYLPMPAFVRDVLTATRMLAAVSRPLGEEATIEGALSDFGLYFLVRTILGLHRSAILQIERSSRKGEIRFTDGEVTSAQVGSLQGEAALHRLLLWEDATLDLKIRAVTRRGSLQKKAADLLEESERFLRDFAHATKDIGTVQTVFATAPDKAAQVPSEVVQVLTLFDGTRSLGDVIDDSPYRVFETLKIISRIHEMGVIQKKVSDRPPPLAAAATPRKPKIEDWVNRAPESSVTASGASQPQPGPEQRSGTANRRRTPRKDRVTAEHATLRAADTALPRAIPDVSTRPPGFAAPAPASPSSPAPPETAAAPAATLSAAAAPSPPRTTGTKEAATRGELRATKREMPAVVSDFPSFVIDLGPPDLNLPAQPPVELPASAPATLAAAPPARVTGGMLAAPSSPRQTAHSMPAAPPAAGSIQLDAAMMAEIDTFEMANSPATPPPELSTPRPTVAPVSFVKEPSGLRRLPQPSSPTAATVGFPTPPPLVTPVVMPAPAAPASPAAPVAPAPLPAAAAPELPPQILSPAPVAIPATAALEAVQAPSLAAEQAAPGARRRGPSTEFDAIEADFFARESDLYKTEIDTFDDLDRGRRR